MDFEKWKETQLVKAKAIPSSEELKIVEFYKKCQRKLNFGSGEILPNQLLILREQSENIQRFFESNLDNELYQISYFDED